MSNQWHYTHGGEQRGPVSPAELKRLAATGGLTPDDQIWREGMEKWVPARTIKGLFGERPASIAADEPPPLPPRAARTAPRQPARIIAGEADEGEERPRKGGGLLLFGLLGGGVLALLMLGGVGAVFFWPKADAKDKGEQVAARPDGREPTHPRSKGDARRPAIEQPADKTSPADPPPKKSKLPELPMIPVKEGPPLVVSAGRLITDYIFHEKEADGRYTGAIVRVTGRYVVHQVDGNRSRYFLAGGKHVLEFYLARPADRDIFRQYQTLCLEGQCLGLVGTRRPARSVAALEAPLVLRHCKILLARGLDGKVVKSRPEGLPARPKEVQARQLCLEYGDDQAAADLKYSGKSFTLSGVVWGVMPTDGEVFLEAGTDVRKVRCLFGSEYQERLKALVKAGALKFGVPVTLRGTCSGVKGDEVRLDNCDFVPTASTTTVPAYLPADKAEPVAARQLVSEYQADEVKADRKYRERLVEVTGVIREARSGVTQGWAEVEIEAGTDTRLHLGCVFASRETLGLDPQINAGRLKAGQTVTIRGLCGGVERSLERVRLENCELATPGGNSTPRRTAGSTETLTADYLPHKPDTTLTYETAAVAGKAVTVIRSQHTHKADGVIETTVLKTGRLTGRDLATGTTRWGKDLNQKAKHPLHHRVKGGFIEIGQHVKGDDEVAWEPVLKVGAKEGETWTWDAPGGGTKKYTLVKFDKHQGRAAILVRAELDGGGPQLVSNHVYVKGVGEVERVTSLVQGPASAVIGQIRLVEGR